MNFKNFFRAVAVGVLASWIGHGAFAAATEIEFKKAGLAASYEWIVQPSSDVEAMLVLKFWDKASSKSTGPYVDPIDKPAIEVFMDMGNGHGHGSAPTRYTRKETGVYEFRRLFFVMTGDWQLRFQIKDKDGHVTDQVVETVKITEGQD